MIVHTGDLFDSHRPPLVEFGRAITAVRRLAEIAPVAVIAGNHDSAIALEILAVAVGDTHLEQLAAGESYDPHAPCEAPIRIHARPTTAARGAVTTYETAGGRRLRLVTLPFVHANRILTDFASLTQTNATYNDSLRIIIGALSQSCFDGYDPTTDVAVFASHLHVKDAHTSSEKTIHISEDYATDPAHLEARYGYLAFGHIHVPQPVADGRGRYAGSILEVNFGERGEDKQVVIADLEPGRPTKMYSVPLTAGRRLHQVRCTLDELATHADEIAAGIVEVTVTAAADGDDTITVGGITFDTLSAAVNTVLPDATVVGVIDARRAYAAIDTDDTPDGGAADTMTEAFRRWLTTDGHSVLAQQGGGKADASRVVGMFDECSTALATGADVELSELAALHALVETDR